MGGGGIPVVKKLMGGSDPVSCENFFRRERSVCLLSQLTQLAAGGNFSRLPLLHVTVEPQELWQGRYEVNGW